MLCDPMDGNPPGSSIHGILQARILEWVAIPFSRGSSWPRDQTRVSCIAGRFFTVWTTREELLLKFSWFKRERVPFFFAFIAYCITHVDQLFLMRGSAGFAIYKFVCHYGHKKNPQHLWRVCQPIRGASFKFLSGNTLSRALLLNLNVCGSGSLLHMQKLRAPNPPLLPSQLLDQNLHFNKTPGCLCSF